MRRAAAGARNRRVEGAAELGLVDASDVRHLEKLRRAAGDGARRAARARTGRGTRSSTGTGCHGGCFIGGGAAGAHLVSRDTPALVDVDGGEEGELPASSALQVASSTRVFFLAMLSRSATA